MRRFLLAICIGAVAGGLVAGLLQQTVFNEKARDAEARPAASAELEALRNEAPEVEAALSYVQAIQSSDVETVIQRVFWLRERVAYIDNSLTVEAERLGAHQHLREDLLRWDEAQNVLSAEGVDDHYVFAPGALIEIAGMDEGLPNLDAPTARRIWLRVVYPVPRTALRDREGRPIQALTVGLNLEAQGLVLKANIIGNLDIDWNSIVLHPPA